jgi:hypothetical protein
VKLLVVTMAAGGLLGLWVGGYEYDPSQRDRWLDQARTALGSDAQTTDIDRALHTVDRVLEATDDWEAHALRTQLKRQRACRRTVDSAEHAFANHDFDRARTEFAKVGPQCKLAGYARQRLDQLAP